MNHPRSTGRFGIVSLVAATAGLLLAIDAGASEYRFIAGQVSDNRAIWEPGVTLIEQDEIKDGKVFFVIENPTAQDHVFAVHGLLEYVPQKVTEWVDLGIPEETMSFYLKPILVKVGPKETKKIQVNARQLQGEHAVGSAFRMFCTLHKDYHLGGAIYVAR